jgi:hypothetical protein
VENGRSQLETMTTTPPAPLPRPLQAPPPLASPTRMTDGAEHPRAPAKAHLLLSDLHPHPLQAAGEYYDAPAKIDFDRLYDDIIKNGLRDPVQVLPPGNRAGLPGYTILDGHTRVAVYRRKLALDGDLFEDIKAKYVAIDTIVRRDLADKTADEIELVYLSFNDNRRQVHMLDRARIAKRTCELERGRRRPGDCDTRDVVGKRLGVSGATLSRWMRATDAPAVVRDLLKGGIIPLIAAARIGLLPPDARKGLAEEMAGPAALVHAATNRRDKIAARKAILGVIDAYVSRPGRRHSTGNAALDAFLKSLRHGLDDLGDRVEDLTVSPDEIPTIDAGISILSILKARALRRQNLAPITVIGQHSRAG